MFLTPGLPRISLSANREGLHLIRRFEDCFYSPRSARPRPGAIGRSTLRRARWHALQSSRGPATGGGSRRMWTPARFRGITLDNTPVWLMNIDGRRAGLFKRWQARKAQVIAWYYKGRIGGGFTYWPDGPHAAAQADPRTDVGSSRRRRERDDVPHRRGLRASFGRADARWSRLPFRLMESDPDTRGRDGASRTGDAR